MLHVPGAKSATKDLRLILEIWQYFIGIDILTG